jgi:hypothetical protein
MTEPVAFPALRSCEELLDDGSEWYYRQVHPTFVDEDNNVGVGAFRCSDGELSGARSSRQTAQGAYEEYRRDSGEDRTAGTWGLTLAQVVYAKGRVVDDSQCPIPPGLSAWPTGHVYLDQRVSDTAVYKQMRDNLARQATKNKRLYPPAD